MIFFGIYFEKISFCFLKFKNHSLQLNYPSLPIFIYRFFWSWYSQKKCRYICLYIMLYIACVKRICSKNSEFEHNCKVLQKQFTKICYGLSSTETEIKKNELLARKELLTPKVTQTGQVLQLTVTYNHTLPNVKQVIQNHRFILNTNKALERAFSIQPIIAFCKNKRLKQLIEGNTI